MKGKLGVGAGAERKIYICRCMCYHLMDEQQMTTIVNLTICPGPDYNGTTDIQHHTTVYIHISPRNIHTNTYVHSTRATLVVLSIKTLERAR